MKLEITDDARRFIAQQGYDPVYGAWPLRRFISREVETRIGRALLSGDILGGAPPPRRPPRRAAGCARRRRQGDCASRGAGHITRLGRVCGREPVPQGERPGTTRAGLTG
jgi:C-terminal, D2-small domain, of ClpB protein